MEITGKYSGFDVILGMGSYSNTRKALYMIARNTSENLEKEAFAGERISTCSVNLPSDELAENEIAIKNTDENEGMLDWLIEKGVVSTPTRYLTSGHSTFPVVKVLKDVN